MKRLLRILRYTIAILLLFASLGLLGAWWIVRRSLPQLDGVAPLPGLQHEVTVDRDKWGVPRIQANSLNDLLMAQGYVLAQDRLWQMDLLRRAAAGELSEIFGLATLANDRENRTLGLRLAAERGVQALDPELRAMLEAYARGVNHYIAERKHRLPWEFRVLGYAPRPWTPADSLLVGAFMWKELTFTARAERKRARLTALVGEERAQDLYVLDSSLDYILVGRSESKPASGKPQKFASRAPGSRLPHATPSGTHGGFVLDYLDSLGESLESMAGSNNWVIGGQHTYSGKPILANDTHLPLEVPSIWYLIHLTAPGWNVRGFTLPGAPLAVIGHNERIAWGFTNTGADVLDLYEETFNPENPDEYRVNGKWRKVERRLERIAVRGRHEHLLEVVTTRHGPVLYRTGTRGYAVRWVATEPGALSFGYSSLGGAQNWSEFREVLRHVPGPSQNVVYADVEGNIGYAMGAWIPRRRNGSGATPVPGENDDFEWTGYVPFDQLPTVFNPPEGWIATANARITGAAFRPYLTDNWMSPFRTNRIYTLLAEQQRHRPEDSIRIQTDVLSLSHLQFARELLRAKDRLASPGADPDLRALVPQLESWDGIALTSSLETSFLEFFRRALLAELLKPHVGADTALYQWWRRDVFLLNVLRERPARWLPSEYSSYDELLFACASESLRRMKAAVLVEDAAHSTDPGRWRWGVFNTLRMTHPLARTGFLRRHLSVPALPISGTSQTVKQMGQTFGPSMRFVADLSDWDNSLMNITMGQSGQYLSRHYRDQFEAWYEGYGLPSAFGEEAVERTRLHRLRLTP